MLLLGRERERAALDRLVESARDGYGGALVVHGEPGVGKTALLDDSVEKADTLRVVRSAGVEGEMELPFAAVQQLCAPILALSGRLPRPQREALEIAFGLSAGPAPSPFLVALAVLGLLSEAARERGLFCVIDDAHWFDRASAQALGFAARRLAVERIAMVSPPGRWARRSADCPRSTSNHSVIATPARCSSRSCRPHWTTRSWIGSSSRRVAIPWPWWSCLAA